MTLEFAINGTPLPVEAILENPDGGVTLPSSAWYGEVSTATIKVDDPFGDYDFRAWDVFTADEDAATNTRIFTGWIMTASMGRGPYKDGPARVWELEIIDQNAALGFNFFRANSAQRPAETDLARVEFILESEPMAWTPVVAGTLTNLTDNPVNLQSYDMVRTTPVEALTTTAGHAGKCFHVFWNHDEERLELYYDQIANYPAATASISNDMADAGADVYYPFIDAVLTRAGDQVYTGELIDFVGGSAFGESTTTIDRLSPTPLSPVSFKRAFMRRSDAIGLLSTANAIIQNDLATQATEENTIQVTIRVPAANVNDVEAGQRMTVKFTHLEGYETDTDVNCIRRDVIPTDGRRDMYDITLELSDKAKLRELDGGNPGNLPNPPCAAPEVVQSKFVISSTSPHSITLDDTPTDGNLLVMSSVFRGSASAPSPDGWTPHPDGAVVVNGTSTAMAWYKTSDGTETTIEVDWSSSNATTIAVAEFTGIAAIEDSGTASGSISANGDPMTAGAVDTSDNAIVFGMVCLDSNSDSDNYTFTAATGWTTIGYFGTDRNMHWAGYQIVASGGTHNPTCSAAGPAIVPVELYAGRSLAFVSSGSAVDCCPDTGQWVRDEFVAEGDGTTTTFFTECPYADGSLIARVDGHPIISGLTEVDGATGEFSLDFAPLAAQGDAPAEQLYVDYQGR